MGAPMAREDLLKRISERPLLQIALDLIDLEYAAKLAETASKAGFDIIEVGTPLLKTHGVEAISRIKRVSGNSIIMVDTKTADAGAFEAEIVGGSGGDAMSVLAIAGNDVIVETISRARDLDVSVWADMIHVVDPVKRAGELRDTGVDLLIMHVGVDIQKRRGITIESLEREIREIIESGYRVAVAGGIRGEAISKMASLGASVIIIGGWITRHHTPSERIYEAVRILRSSLGR
jgi:3-hexulose-6-phosphate synthase